jgi:hypothetical protein
MFLKKPISSLKNSPSHTVYRKISQHHISLATFPENQFCNFLIGEQLGQTIEKWYVNE